MSVAFQVCKTVHTKTRNELEQPGTTWNELKPTGTSWNGMKLAKTSTRKSYAGQLQEQLLVAPMYQTGTLRQTDNNTNTQSFHGNGISSEQHQLEINALSGFLFQKLLLKFCRLVPSKTFVGLEDVFSVTILNLKGVLQRRFENVLKTS